MSNWDNGDNDSMVANLETAANATGALQEQADIYAESWEAASDRVQASLEAIYGELFQDEFFIDVTNTIADVIDVIGQMIDSIGGVKGVIALLGVIITKVFATDIANGVNNAIHNFQRFTGQAQAMAEQTRTQAYKMAMAQTFQNFDTSNSVIAAMRDNLKNAYIEQHKLTTESKHMTQDQIDAAKYAMDIAKGYREGYLAISQMTNEMEELKNKSKETLSNNYGSGLSTKLSNFNRTEFSSQNAANQIQFAQEINASTRAMNQMLPAAERLSTTQNYLNNRIREYQQVLRTHSETSPQAIAAENNLATAIWHVMQASENITPRFEQFNSNVSALASRLSPAITELTEFSLQINQVNPLKSSEATEQWANRIRNLEDAFASIADESLGVNNDFTKFLNEMRNGSLESDKLIERFKALDFSADSMGEVFRQVVQAQEEVNASTQEGVGAINTENATIKDFISAVLKSALALDSSEKAEREAARAHMDSMYALQAAKTGYQSLGAAASALMGTMSQVAMAMSSLSSLKNVWENEDMSSLEKWSSIMMSLSFGLPALISGLSGVGKMMRYITNTTSTGLPVQLLHLMGVKDEKLATQLMIKDKEKEQWVRFKNTENLTKEAIAEKMATGEIQKETKANWANVASQIAKHWYIVAIAVAIGALVGGIYLLVKAENEEEDTVKRLNENYNELNNVLNETKTRADEVKNSFSGYDDVANKLSECTKGTKEWNNALKENNDKVLELLDKYPELASMTNDKGQKAITRTDGVLKVADWAQQQIEDKMIEDVRQANSAVLIGEMQLREAEEKLMNKQIERQKNQNFGYTSDNAQMLQTSIGTAIGTAVGAVMGPEGAVMGGAIGMALAENNIEQNREMRKIYEDVYNKYGTSVTKEDFQDALNNSNLNFPDTEQLSTKMFNLANEENKNTEAIKANTEALKIKRKNIIEELFGEYLPEDTPNREEKIGALGQGYEGKATEIASEYKNRISYRDSSGVYYGKTEEEVAQKYAQATGTDYNLALSKVQDYGNKNSQFGKTGVSKGGWWDWLQGWGSRDEEYWNEYIATAGLEDKGYKFKTTTGTDNERKFVYEVETTDENGNVTTEEKSIPLDTMISQMVAARTAKELELDNYTKTIDNLSNQNELQAEGLKSFLGNQDFTQASQKEINAVRTNLADANSVEKYLLNNLGQEGENIADVASRLGYETADNLINTFTTTLNQVDTFAGLKDQLQAGEISLEEYQTRYQKLLDTVDQDVDSDTYEDWSKQIKGLAETTDDFTESTKDNEDACDDLSEAVIRYGVAVQKAKGKLDEWKKVEKDSNNQYKFTATQLEEVRGAYADLLDVNEADLSDNFVKNADNMKLFEEAINGSITAENTFRANLAKDYLMGTLGLDSTELNTKLQQIEQETGVSIESIQARLNSLKPGAIDDTELLNSILDMCTKMGLSVSDASRFIKDAFSIDAELTTDTTEITENQEFLDSDFQPNEPETVDGITYDDNGSMVQDRFKVYDGGTWTLKPAQSKNKKQITAPALKLKDGTTANFTGGNITKKNLFTKLNTPTTGGTINPKGSGGNKGGSSFKPTKKKKKNEEVERYHEITQVINDQTKSIEKLSAIKDRAFGVNRVKAMEAEIEAQKKLLEYNEEYYRQIKKNLNDDRWELANNVNIKSGSIQPIFDENGRISNWTAMQESWVDDLNAKIDEYNKKMEAYNNSGNKDNDEKEAIEKIKTDAEELWEIRKKITEDYEDSYKKAIEQEAELDNQRREIADLALAKINDTVELKIQINDNELEIVDYYLSKIEDDYTKGAEAFALMNSKIEPLTNNLKLTQQVADEIREKALNGEDFIEWDDYLTHITDSLPDLISKLQELNELDKSMMEYYGEYWEQAADKFNEYYEQIGQASERLEKYNTLLELTGQQKAYGKINTLLKGQLEAANDAYDSSVAMRDLAQSEVDRIQAEYNTAIKSGNNAAAELWETQLKAAKEKLDEYENQVLDDLITKTELANSILENSLAKARDELDKGLFDGLGADQYMKELDRLSAKQEEYLTQTNKMYETNKLIRQAQLDMDKTSNTRAKQQYDDYVKYIEQLQQSGQLSNYELSIAQARYEVLQAQIALEEAQDAKSEVRLTRDSEGNFGYVYTANEEAIANAEGALADAENKLYNIGLEGAQDYQSKIVENRQAYIEEIAELEEQRKNGEIESDEEYLRRREEIYDFYYNQEQQFLELYHLAIDTLEENSYTKRTDYLLKDIENLGSFEQATEIYLQEVNDAWDLVAEHTKDASDATSRKNIKLETEEVTTATRNLKDEIQDELMPNLQNQFDKIGEITEQYAAQRREITENLIPALEEEIRKRQELGQIAVEEQPDLGLDYYNHDFSAEIANATDDAEITKLKQQEAAKLARNIAADIEEYAANGYERSSSQVQNAAWARERKIKENNLIGKVETTEALLNRIFGPKPKGAVYLDTGGYTGEWGPEGRLAMLHQKELVLNENDTANILASVSMIREISKALDLAAASSAFELQNLRAQTIGTFNEERLQQDVHIEANFPNVVDHNEIELAIDNLINAASQYAN